MEITHFISHKNIIYKKVISFLILLICSTYILAQPQAQVQSQPKQYFIKDGKININLSKQIDEKDLAAFNKKYNLDKLQLQKFIKENFVDSLIKQGWDFEKNTKDEFIISKPLFGSSDVQSPIASFNVLENKNEPDNLFASFGVNIIKKQPFNIENNIVTFKLLKNKDAQKVQLAGSFTNWESKAINMSKFEDGWIAKVELKPGKHLYKFIVDGDWQLDNNNQNEENDGRGNNNSVYFQPNYVFTLKGFADAKKVVLAGSFNHWDEYKLKLKKNEFGEWQLPVYLSNGTYTYKYIVDGNWTNDPNNPNTFSNEYNDKNNYINIGEASTIELKGFASASKVFLMGNFNNYRDYELQMKKTETGWSIDYVLGDGNYEYKFLIDGKYYNANGEQIKPEDGGSTFVNNPNYTFTLKGYENAQSVLISGDFNKWSEKGFALKKENGVWVAKMNVPKGKHLYKFIVDGNWIIDPGNKLWEENEHNTGNSIVWID